MAILSTGLEKLSHFALAPTAERTDALDGTAVDLNDYEGDIVVILDVDTEQASAAVAFAQVEDDASKQYLVFPKGAAKRWVKAVSAVDTSTHTYSINALGAKKYA